MYNRIVIFWRICCEVLSTLMVCLYMRLFWQFSRVEWRIQSVSVFTKWNLWCSCWSDREFNLDMVFPVYFVRRCFDTNKLWAGFTVPVDLRRQSSCQNQCWRLEEHLLSCSAGCSVIVWKVIEHSVSFSVHFELSKILYTLWLHSMSRTCLTARVGM